MGLHTGVVALASREGNGSGGLLTVAFCMTATPRQRTVLRMVPEDELYDLMLGVPQPNGRLRTALERLGWLSEGPLCADPFLLARLEALDREVEFTWRHLNNGAWPRLRAALLDAHAQRKFFREDLYQTPLVPASVLLRCAEIHHRGPRQRILLLGDDDLASLLLAALGHHVTVLETDSYILRLIQHLAPRWNVRIELVQQDYTQPIPGDYAGQYDASYADPPATALCLRAALHRGLTVLAAGGRGYFSTPLGLEPWLLRELRAVNARSAQVLRRLNVYYLPQNFQLSQDTEDVYVIEAGQLANITQMDRPVEAASGAFRNSIEVTLDFFTCQKPIHPEAIGVAIASVYGDGDTMFLGWGPEQDTALLIWQGRSGCIACHAQLTRGDVSLSYKPRNACFRPALGRTLLALLCPQVYDIRYFSRYDYECEEA